MNLIDIDIKYFILLIFFKKFGHKGIFISQRRKNVSTGHFSEQTN